MDGMFEYDGDVERLSLCLSFGDFFWPNAEGLLADEVKRSKWADEGDNLAQGPFILIWSSWGQIVTGNIKNSQIDDNNALKTLKAARPYWKKQNIQNLVLALSIVFLVFWISFKFWIFYFWIWFFKDFQEIHKIKRPKIIRIIYIPIIVLFFIFSRIQKSLNWQFWCYPNS